MQLSIKLFGGFQVLLGGQRAVFATDRSRALLAYLAVESGRPHRRAMLAGLVWPDRPESLARKNFSQSLYRLRLAIRDHRASPTFLCITSRTIQFNAGAESLDVARFEALLNSREVHPHRSLETCSVCLDSLEQAAGLYAGDFLQGLSLADSQPFEEWARLKREQYHRQALNALWLLAARALEQGEYERAQCFAERQLALEPWREEAYHQLMQALLLSGQRSLALIRYRNYRDILAEEMGVEPAPDIVALYERIRLGQPSPVE